MEMEEKFGMNLAAERERIGMSQEELATRAAVHRTQISLLETGRRRPRLDTLVKLAGALGIAPSALIEGISWDPTLISGGFRVSDRADEPAP
jgi:transcriptional regulator with XRE-family HTH domain